MEMGKLTAKLRDAVPVCLMVEGNEIKRYKNIEIPDELKKLEYQEFKFDVPLHGPITFKIMFAPGVLPEEYPKTRERRTRESKDTLVITTRDAPTTQSNSETAAIEAVNTADSNNAMTETKALIIIQGCSDVEIPENVTQQEAGNETYSSVAIQDSTEATPEANAELEAKVASTTKKAATKPKKAPTTTKGSIK